MAVALVTLSIPAYAGKPGAVLVPPVAAELGAGAPIGVATPAATSTELHIGVHWASLAWKPTPLDIGIGYAGSYRTLPGDGLARPEPLSLHGIYFEIAYALENHRHWRTWVGGRVEQLNGRYEERALNVIGGSVRLSAELFAAGAHAASDRNVLALLAGAWALGVYVEGTARTLPDELGPLGVGAGVSMRVPFILAVAD